MKTTAELREQFKVTPTVSFLCAPPFAVAVDTVQICVVFS